MPAPGSPANSSPRGQGRLPNFARAAHKQGLDPLRQLAAVDVHFGLDIKVADRVFPDSPQAANQCDVEDDGHIEEQRIALVDPHNFELESVDVQRVADFLVELIGDGAADHGV